MDWAEDATLKNMVLSFRVSELHLLLGYAGKSKAGRKTELQARALELIKGSKALHMSSKIKEIYRSIPYKLTKILDQKPSPMCRQSSSGSSPDSLFNGGRENDFNGYSSSVVDIHSMFAGAAENVLRGLPTYGAYSCGSSNSGGVNQRYMTVPICPDVKMKKLPFYDVITELIKPTTLVSSHGSSRLQEGVFPFCLTPQQITTVKASKELVRESFNSDEMKFDFKTQVQLRFCLLDSSSEQSDNFPPSICVKVNGSIVSLPPTKPSHRPGVEPKRPSEPLDVTEYVKLNPSSANSVSVTWVSDGSGQEWVISLYLVKKVTSGELLTRVKTKGTRPADFTKGMIKEIVNKDDGDCQIAMTSLQVSLNCPLGKCRMSLPCRASTCTHLQCFDAQLFLQMNERKPTWICPVCDRQILFENLSVDGYFQEVLNSLSFDAGNEVEIFPDGTWKPLKPVIKKEKQDPDAGRQAKKRKLDSLETEAICIDDEEPKPCSSKNLVKQSSTISEASTVSAGVSSFAPSANKTVDVIDLVSSSDEEEEDIAPKKRRPRPIAETSSSSSDNQSETTEDESSSSSSSSSSAPSTVVDAGPPIYGQSSSSSPVVIQHSNIRRDSSSPEIVILDTVRSSRPATAANFVNNWLHSMPNFPVIPHYSASVNPETSRASSSTPALDAMSRLAQSNAHSSSTNRVQSESVRSRDTAHQGAVADPFPPDDFDLETLEFLDDLDRAPVLNSNRGSDMWDEWEPHDFDNF